MHRRIPRSLRTLSWVLIFAFGFESAMPLGLPSAEAVAPPLAQLPLQDPAWLEGTVDADTSDGFIQAKMAEIGPGLDAAVAFVRDEIGYEVYRGSLRGARGALWSAAGNSVDQASLLIALLRAQGIPARYVRGTLADADAQELVGSIFDPELMAQSVGYIPEEYDIADPENDPDLLAEARDHWWVELEDGTQIDPCFADGAPRATATETHFEIPDVMRHKVTLRVVAEFQGAIFSMPSEETPLVETFPSAKLCGRPPVLAFNVSVDQSPTLIGALGIKQFNYVPYLVLDDGDADPSNDERISGAPFTEMFGFLNLVNTTLTRLRLEIDTTDPVGVVRAHSRDLLDRIGFGARHGMGDPAVVTAEKPALNELQSTAVHIVCGPVAASILGARKTMRLALAAEAEELFDGMSALDGKPSEAWTEEDRAVARKGTELVIRGLRLDLRIIGEKYLLASFPHGRNLADTFLVRAYPDHPLVVLCDAGPNAETDSMQFGIDLRHNMLRAVPYPGQSTAAPALFALRRGYEENLAEREVMEQVRLFLGRNAGSRVLSTISVFEAAAEQDVPILLLSGPGDIARAESLDLSGDAKARILLALADDDSVNVPERMVEIDGEETVGWYRIDAETGESIAVMESGCHQAIADYGLVVYLASWAALYSAISIHRWYLCKFLPWLRATEDYIDREIEQYRRGNEYNELGDRQQVSFDAQTMLGMANVTYGEQFGSSDRIFIDKQLTGMDEHIHTNFYERDELGRPILDENGDPILYEAEEGSLDWRWHIQYKHDRLVEFIDRLQDRASTFAGTVQEAQDLIDDLEALRGQLENSWDTAVPVNVPPAFLDLNDDMNRIMDEAVELVRDYEQDMSKYESTAAYEEHQRQYLEKILAAGRPGNSTIKFRGTDVEVVSLFVYPERTEDVQFEEIPGLRLEVVHDPVFGIKTGSTQVPTAFRVRLVNTGTFDLSFHLEAAAAPGWDVLMTRSTHAVRAAAMSRTSLFLQPRETAALPAVGTPVPFTVTATSTIDPAVTVSRDVAFEMPAVPAVLATVSPERLALSPNGSADVTIRLQNVGNVDQSVEFSATAPAGLDAGALPAPTVLTPGQNLEEPWTITALGLPLDTEHEVVIQMGIGDPALDRRAIRIPVKIAPPGAQQAEDAAASSRSLGRADVAESLEGISVDAAALHRDPESAPVRSRLVATIGELAALLDDPLLAGYATAVQAAGASIRAASPANTGAALDELAAALGDLAARLALLADHDFEMALRPNSGEALPQTPTDFGLSLRNVGNSETTYDLSIEDVPAGITASLSQDSITLPPGFAIEPGVSGSHHLPIAVNATLTQPADELTAFEFRVVATAREAPEVTRSAFGRFTARAELVDVISVRTDPAFTDPGGSVDVSARVLNAVNRDRDVLVKYRVRDPGGTEIFASDAQEEQLTVLSSLETFDLGGFNTTGLDRGTYEIEVAVAEADGTPIPGATGLGTLLVGSPVTASLAATPGELPPGDGTAAIALDVQAAVGSGGDAIALVGAIDTTGTGYTVAVADGHAYVGGSENVTILDIDDPENPDILDTFGSGAAFRTWSTKDHLYVARGLNLDVYRLENLDSPTFLASAASGVTGTFGTRFLVHRDVALNNTVIYGWSGSTILIVRGDVIIYDISDPENPQALGLLYNYPHSFHPEWPGSEYSFGELGSAGKDDVVYIPSASAKTTGEGGTGRLRMLDVSDPQNVHEADHYDIPGTVLLHAIGVSGDHALVAGTTGHFAMVGGKVTALGNVTLHLLDVSDPWNPSILGSTTLTDIDQDQNRRLSMAAGPDDVYALGNVKIGGQDVLRLIDARDPADIDVIDVNTAGTVNRSLFHGNILYTAGSSGLSIYDLGGLVGIPVSVFVDVPNNGSADPVAGTLVPAPDAVLPNGSDRFMWSFTLDSTTSQQVIAWSSDLPGLRPGEARTVALGGRVEFTALGSPGVVQLPKLQIPVEHILSLDPGKRTVRPGESAQYALSLRNPTAAGLTFDLAAEGVAPGWAALLPTVDVPAGGTVEADLVLTPDSTAPLGPYAFSVMASAGTIEDSVQGSLMLRGATVPKSLARGVVVGIDPTSATAGQATSAEYTVRITNTGNVTDEYGLSATLPAGFTAEFSTDSVEVSPGLDSYREVLLTVTPDPGTSPGDAAFEVEAVSTSDASVSYADAGIVTVSALGVQLALSPATGTPNSAFDLIVDNTGTVAQTFDLALGGTAAPAATLQQDAVTLDPGASQTVTVDVGEIDYAFPGDARLVALATARDDADVKDTAVAMVEIPETRGIAAFFQPPVRILEREGTALFLLEIENTGNVDEAFSASIDGATGPVAANLRGLDGQPVQSIPSFRLPGRSAGALAVETDLTALGEARVTVGIAPHENGEGTSDEAIVAAVPLRIAKTTQSSRIIFDPVDGLDHTLEAKESLTDGGSAWTDLPGGPHNLGAYVDSDAAARRFYGLRISTPPNGEETAAFLGRSANRVGKIERVIPAGTIGSISSPMTAFAADRGVIGTAGSDSITQPGKGWTPSRFGPGVEGYLTHFVEILDGDNAGRSWPVAGNTSDTLQLDTQGEAISALGLPGARYVVRPFLSVSEFFSDAVGDPLLSGGENPSEASNILAWNGQGFDVIYFSTFAGENQWRQAGGVPANEWPLYPDEGLLVINRGDTDARIESLGEVAANTKSPYLFPGLTLVGTPFPADVMLDDSALLDGVGGPFQGAASPALADQVLLWDGVGYDLYYHSTLFGENTWRKAGGGPAGGAVLEAGSAYFINNQAGGGGLWPRMLPYEP